MSEKERSDGSIEQFFEDSERQLQNIYDEQERAMRMIEARMSQLRIDKEKVLAMLARNEF